jgi:hypothetical protein
VAWLEEEHMTLLHMIPHRAGLSIDPLHINFPYPAHMNTTVHFIGLGETAADQLHKSVTLTYYYK